MNIKCPVGGCDIDFATMDDLYQHFLDNPHQMNFKYFYWEMYKKIHEKIEFYSKTHNSYSTGNIRLLKSLLGV